MYGIPTNVNYPPAGPPPPPNHGSGSGSATSSMTGGPTGGRGGGAPIPQQQQQVVTGGYAARSAVAYAANVNVNDPAMMQNQTQTQNQGMNMNMNNPNMNQGMQNQGPVMQNPGGYGYASNTSPNSSVGAAPAPYPNMNMNMQQPQQQQMMNQGMLQQQNMQPNQNQMPSNMPPQPPPQQPYQYQYQQPSQQQQQQQQPSQQQQQQPMNNNMSPYNQPQFQPQQPIQIQDPAQMLLQQSIRRMQESAHIMRGAMEANDLSETLDKACAMLGELGDPKHSHKHHPPSHGGAPHHHYHRGGGTGGQLKGVVSPKHYYELHMMALDELPNLEEYFLSLENTMCQIPLGMFSMKELYQVVQYCPRSVPRLYLQICAGSALLRSREGQQGQQGGDVQMQGDGQGDVQGQGDGQVTVKSILKDLREGVKCVQCPIRGLFLRHYLLQAMKDKLPDEAEGRGDEDVEGDGDFGLNVEDSMQEIEYQYQQRHQDGHAHADAHVGEDLLQGLGVNSVDADVDLTLDEGAGENHKTHNDALQDLMGGLGVDFNQDEAPGGFMDVPIVPAPVASPPTVPPMPRAPAPMPPAMSTGGTNAISTSAAEQAKEDDPNSPGTVKDSYEFVLSNFIEMNKLWVRIQHMPGDSKTRETKRTRERERNELRMMVGTNLVRLSELEGVTSAIYGTIILPKILDQIVACHDPLAQAYLMDCIIQVFPDEFHIQTLEVVLSVCPKLREKVNIRTILQSVMNRLANYYSDELLLNDEEDTEGVKMSVMMDSFSMFDHCIKSVLDVRGVKLTAREAIRLESALMDFTLKCYPGQMDHIDRCLGVCASALRGEGNHGIIAAGGGNVPPRPTPIPLDDRAIIELEKLLSLPLEELALGVLDLEHYAELLALLPWDNRKEVAVGLLKVLDTSGEAVSSASEVDQLFSILTPLLKNNPISGGGANASKQDQALIAKVIHIIHNEDTDAHFEMLTAVKRNISECGGGGGNIVPLFYSALNLLNRVRDMEFPKPFPVEEYVEEVVTQEEEAQLKDVPPEPEEKDQFVEETVPEEEDQFVEETEDELQEPEQGGEVVEETEDTMSKEAEKEDDLSYGDDKEDFERAEDDISYVEDEEGLDAKDCVDELAADLHTVVNVEEEKHDEQTQTEAAQRVPTEEFMQSSIQGDMFADSPLGDVAEPEKVPPALPAFTKLVNCRKIFVFVQSLVANLNMQDGEQCFKLYIQAAAAADCCASVVGSRGGNTGDFAPIAYTFFTEAFLAYETGISDSKVQVNAITTMVGALLSCKAFSSSDYETLITKVTQYAARLLKKIDQCKMVMLCSHLFYVYGANRYQNPQRTLECLQRSLKVADVCVSSNPGNLQLFVDIFDIYLYHFEKENPMISDKYISGLIALVNEHIASIGGNPTIADAKSQFIQTVKHIEEKKIEARFSGIVCNISD